MFVSQGWATGLYHGDLWSTTDEDSGGSSQDQDVPPAGDVFSCGKGMIC